MPASNATASTAGADQAATASSESASVASTASGTRQALKNGIATRFTTGPTSRNFAEVPRRQRQQREPDPPLEAHEVERGASDAPKTARRFMRGRLRRRQREQDRDCDERQPERRRQRRERIEDEHGDERRRNDLGRADSTAARERNQRNRDHDERALRRHGEARQRRVVGRREQARRGRDFEIEARERRRQSQASAPQRDEHDDPEQRDVHPRDGDEVARARAAKIGPVLLRETKPLAERERRQQRDAVGIRARARRCARRAAARNLRQRVAIAPPGASRTTPERT